MSDLSLGLRQAKTTAGERWVIALLVLLALVTITPLLFMVLNTIKTRDEYNLSMFSLPSVWSLKNFAIVWNAFDLVRLNLNTILISGTSIVASLVVCSLAGYSLSKIPFQGKQLVTLVIVAGMFMPGQVLILPVYAILIDLHLINNPLGLVLFYVASSIPFTTFLVVSNLKSMPGELLESARMDGAGSLRIYAAIVLPMLRPTLATVGLLNFIGYWNELLYAMIILQDESLRTVTISVMSLVNRFGGNAPLLYSGLLLNSLPVVLLFFVFNRQLVKGLSAGAIK